MDNIYRNVENTRLSFRDSSDDDVSHEAIMNVLADDPAPTPRRSAATMQRSEAPTTWSRITNYCARAFTWATAGNRQLTANEPFMIDTAPSTATPSSLSQWHYVPPRPATPLVATPTPPSPSVQEVVANPTTATTQNVDIDLRETILQYNRTGLDFYYNIILVTLKYNTRPITSDVFSAARGNPVVIKTLLNVASVDENDFVVREIIQEEVDRVLSGNVKHCQYVPADQADYLRSLCQVKSTRLTVRQVMLLRYSGFEFIKLLADFPYLTANIPEPMLCISALYSIGRTLRFVVIWLGILGALLFLAATVWIVVFWFQQTNGRNSAYWTIICYVAAYVMTVIWTFRVEEDKIMEYEEQCWPYPNNNLVLIPVVPVYAICLSLVALHYKWLRSPRRYLVISYDLYNGIALQQVIFALFNVAPQIVVQMYLFTRGNRHLIDRLPICFWLLIGSGAACFFKGVFSFNYIIIASHSCNIFGFAIMTIDECKASQRCILPSNTFTHNLFFYLVYFCVAIAVSLLITLLNTRACNGSDLAFISVYVVVTALTVIALICILIYVRPARFFGFIAVPVIVLEVARYIIARVNERDDPQHLYRCLLVDRLYTAWTLPLFITFGCLCVSFLLWAALISYEVIMQRRLSQRIIDKLLFL